jgi:hypothetical protein
MFFDPRQGRSLQGGAALDYYLDAMDECSNGALETKKKVSREM